MRPRNFVLAFMLLGTGIVVWLLGTGRVGPDAGSPTEPTREPGTASPDNGMSAEGPTLEGTNTGSRSPEVATAVVLTGRVLDDRTSAPVAAAMVIAFQEDENGLRLGTSDKEGRYTLKGLSPGAWLLTAVHRLYVPLGMDALAAKTKQPPPDTMRLSIPADASVLPAFDLRLRAGRRFRGRVVDGNGAPIAGAHIRLNGRNAGLRRLRRRLGVSTDELNARFPVWSDAEGRFESACLPPALGKVRFAAFKPGHMCRWTEPLSVDPEEAPHELELVLLASATIQGHVRYANGDPAEGCDIDIAFGSDAKKEWLFESPADVESDADGAYTLSGLPPTTVEVEADWIGPYLEGDAQSAEDLRPGEVRTGIDFTVPRRFVLRARLTDAAGTPLGKELLLIESTAEMETEPIEEDALTDDEGRIETALASPGPLRITHRSPGRSTVLREALMVPTDEVTLVSEATPRTRIELRVAGPDGNPVARFRSSMWSLAGDAIENKVDFDSDGDGRDGTAVHGVQGHPPFAVMVGQARDAEGRALEFTTALVRVEHVPPAGVVEVQLGLVGRLTGRFIDVNGRPVGGARLALVATRRHPERRIEVPVAADGTFSFDVPHVEDTRFLAAFRVHVEVPAGYLPIAPIPFRPKRPQHEFVLVRGGTVAGHVVAPASSRLEGLDLVFVSWEERAGDPPKLATIRSMGLDANRQFEAVGVPTDRELRVGIHPQEARKLGLFSPRDIRGVRAGRRDLTLELKPGLTLSGMVTFAEAPKHPHFVIAVPHRQAVTGGHEQVGDDGSFQFEGLTPGTYTLHLLSARGTANVTLATKHVTAGDEDVALRVGALGSIRVRLDGDAEFGASVIVWKAGTFERRAYVSGGAAEVVLEGLPVGDTYDLVAEGRDGPMGSRLGVRTGEAVTIELAESVVFAGQLDTERPLASSRLIARGTTGPFQVYVDDRGAFETDVMPGVYDVFLVDIDGTQHRVATGVKAGRDDYAFTLK